MTKIFPGGACLAASNRFADAALLSDNVVCPCDRHLVVLWRVRRVFLHSAAARDMGPRELKLALAGSRRRKAALHSIFLKRFGDTSYGGGPPAFAEQDEILP